MSVKTRDLGLTAYDELFQTDDSRAELARERVTEIALSDIDGFPEHPFQVNDDEAMLEMAESVKKFGVITPAVVRQKEDGRYELISGHRRKRACELAGLDAIPAVVRDMSRDEAIIFMVDSNLQREKILPSEKAFSYKMRLDALRRQAGRPSKDNSAPLEPNLIGVRSNDQLAESVGESTAQIKRYIRLTKLIPPILELVDNALIKDKEKLQIAFRPAVELSYLSEKEQQALFETMECEDATPSLEQAIKMKQFSQSGRLNEDVILSIMSEEKPNQREKISFQAERLRKYIPKSVPPNKTEDYVIQALEHYQRFRERQRDRER